MEVDTDRVDTWYTEISGFLESHIESEDLVTPWSLTVALCHVLADAAEQVNVSERKKLETVIKLVANSMGFDDVLVFLGKDADPDSIS